MNRDNNFSRKEKAFETRTKIFENAQALFKNHGFLNVSVDSIVEAAGVAKGSFYVHFNSKDALIAEILTNNVNNIDLDYKSFVDSQPKETTTSDLMILLAGKIADVIAHRLGYDIMRVIYEAQLTKTINAEAILGYNRNLYKLFNNIIDRGIKSGEFKNDLPVEVISNHCVISLRGMTYEWCVRYPDFDLKLESERHFILLLSGLKNHS